MAVIHRNTIRHPDRVQVEEVHDDGRLVIDDGGTVTETTADPDTLARLIDQHQARQRRQRLDQAAATLRSWAEDARGVNVAPMTVAQHKQVTQTMVDRLGVFFDRFADLLDER